MIKIISGYSHAAGSTLALANLCNEFNSRGHACVFYGPDNWHFDKCNSGKLAEFSPESGDTIIVNDIPLLTDADLSNINALVEKNRGHGLLKTLGERIKKLLPSKASPNYKLFLTRLNNDALRLSSVRITFFHKIHFTSNALRGYCSVSYPKFIAPSFCSDLQKTEHKPEKTGGVIGSIKKQNNIVEAIEEALLDGMETVTIFGNLEDPLYYYESIVPLTIKYPGSIKYAGFMDNRQKMYDAVSDVYSPVKKPWSVVGQECVMTNTKFHAPDPLSAVSRLANDQIFEIWKNELAL